MHAFGMYNYLHCDSWYQDSVYYIDNLGRIMNLKVMLVRKKYIILWFSNKFDLQFSLWFWCPEYWYTHTFHIWSLVSSLCKPPFLFNSILIFFPFFLLLTCIYSPPLPPVTATLMNWYNYSCLLSLREVLSPTMKVDLSDFPFS